MKKITWLFILLLFACSSVYYSNPLKPDPPYVFEGIAWELCPEEDICKDNAAVVPSLFDLDTMKPDSLGLLLSEYLKGALVKVCGCEIYEFELRRKISEGGLKALIDDISQLRKRDVHIRWAVVGTYREEGNSVVLFIRLVDLATGKTKRFVIQRVEIHP